MYSDPIADMFTRIRNGYLAKKTTVSMQNSKMKVEVAKLLQEYSYIKGFETQKIDDAKTELVVELLYSKGKPAITKISRVSKAGRRIYRDRKTLPFVLSGIGLAIVSTSKGIMSADKARKEGIGGEVVGEVY